MEARVEITHALFQTPTSRESSTPYIYEEPKARPRTTARPKTRNITVHPKLKSGIDWSQPSSVFSDKAHPTATNIERCGQRGTLRPGSSRTRLVLEGGCFAGECRPAPENHQLFRSSVCQGHGIYLRQCPSTNGRGCAPSLPEKNGNFIGFSASPQPQDCLQQATEIRGRVRLKLRTRLG